MCGRYYIDIEESELRAICKEIEEQPGLRVKTGEIRPTNIAPVLIRTDNGIVPRAMSWGFPKKWASGVIVNARAETALDPKKMWRKSLLCNPLLIPMSGFYEWRTNEETGKKEMFLFKPIEGTVLYIAGFYEMFNPEPKLLAERFTMLTTEPNVSVKDYHDRMPLVLGAEDRQSWLDHSMMEEILKKNPLMVKAVKAG